MNKEDLKNEILRLNKEASEMKLGDLCQKVLSGSFTPGIHDHVLLERCRKKDKCGCKPKKGPNQQDLPYICG